MVRSSADYHAYKQEYADDAVTRTVPSQSLAVPSESIEIKPKKDY